MASYNLLTESNKLSYDQQKDKLYAQRESHAVWG